MTVVFPLDFWNGRILTHTSDSVNRLPRKCQSYFNYQWNNFKWWESKIFNRVYLSVHGVPCDHYPCHWSPHHTRIPQTCSNVFNLDLTVLGAFLWLVFTYIWLVFCSLELSSLVAAFFINNKRSLHVCLNSLDILPNFILKEDMLLKKVNILSIPKSLLYLHLSMC